MARSYRGAGVIRWGAQDGKDGVNYLIMGWFSKTIQYKLTDAGIPVVKVEDTSPDKFSVYKLTALQSTLGIFVASEWEKVKSADFVYMQDAYIERLQAVLITAERIEALDIVHPSGLYSLIGGKLKVQDAEIEGKITSKEGEFSGLIKTKNPAFPKAIIEIDGESNSMSVKDTQGEVKVLISPTEIGDIDDYFSDSVTRSFYGEIGLSESGLSRKNVFTPTGTIYAVKGDVFQISYDSLSIYAQVWNRKPEGTSWEPIRVDVSALLRINEESFTLGSVSATTSYGSDIVNNTVNIKEGSIIYTAKSSGNLQFRLQGAYLPSKPISIGEDYSVYGDTRRESGNLLKIEKVVNRSQIGIDGMMIANSKTSYTYMGQPAFETRRGNKGIRITPDGYFKLNSSGQWVEWNI